MVLGVIVTTLFITQFVRQDISDLRNYSRFKDFQDIAGVNSSGKKVSFEIGDICKPLENLQQALIINISGYLEFSDDDVEILSMTNEGSGIRVVVNEARQPIIYFSDPNLESNVKGYELLPTAGESISELSKKLEFTVRLFWVSDILDQELLIYTTTNNPKNFSQLDLVSDLRPDSVFCNSIGSVGHIGSGNSINATFSLATIDEKDIGVLRNLRARVAVLAFTILSTLIVAIWVRQRSTFK